MPRINRLRIINFSYNNDVRHILDETFNFYGGENALLNLANGGGKSVLVQLMLQPVVPGIKIQGRHIAGFFRRKSLPAYILLEWKLDGAGGYLLTGIGIVAAEGSGLEEEKNRIKYFTFTSKYTAANAFDLANLELVKSHGNTLEIKPFKEAREMMAEKARKDPYLFGCFTDEDGERYRQRLAEFGIAQDEWKNIMAKINDHEGGLEEIFQKYKNSGQLLNDWIIKTIEKVIFQDRAQARRLEEMLENLVREVSENERFIVEKQLLEQFLADYGEQVGELEKLLNGLEEEKALAGRLVGLYHFLNGETVSLQEKTEENTQKIDLCKREKQRIELEERSYSYFLRLAEHIEAAAKLAQAEQDSQETEEKLEAAKRAGRIMRAAGLHAELEQKRAALSGVEEKLAASRSQYDRDGRVRNLEYSLKKLTEETLQALEQDLADLRNGKAEQENRLHELQRESGQLDQKLRNCEKAKGRLQGQKNNHEDYEREVSSRLGIRWNRNLLGELMEADIAGIKELLAQNHENLFLKGQKLAAEKSSREARQQEIDGEIKALQESRIDARDNLNSTLRDIVEYEKKEREVLAILQKYGFVPELRFDRERLQSAFHEHLQMLARRRDGAARRRDEMEESLQALKNGRLHIPEEMIDLLADLDISYDTGEGYLRNQPVEIRQRMLEANPVLPYALIMAKDFIPRLAQAMAHVTFRRVIPIIAYEDLKVSVNGSGRVVQAGEGISLVCLYEGRVFAPESLVKLETELSLKKQEAGEQYEHYAVEHKEAVSGQALCARFAYPEDYRYQLEKRKREYENGLKETETRIAFLEDETKKLRHELKDLEAKSQALQKSQEKAQEAIEIFDRFLRKEHEYQECLRNLADVEQMISAAEERKAELTSQLENIQGEINRFALKINNRERELQTIREKYALYQHAPEGERVAGTLAELEERLQALKDKYGEEITQLETRQKELRQEVTRKEREINKLNLREEEYAGVVYDEGALDRINADIISLEKVSKERQQEVIEAARAESAAETACAIALEEVKKLGAESPLPQEAIKGDFTERRRQVSDREKKLEQENRELTQQITEYNKLMDKISSYINVAAIEPDPHFRPGQDLKAQVADLAESYRDTQNNNKNQADHLQKRYTALKADYQDKNTNISNIFKGLEPFWAKPGMEFDDYYYLYERMSQHQDKLLELIRLHENQLANLERDKKDMIQQSLLQGMRFYEEILAISENSQVHLQGRSRPVQMLKIEMQFDNNEAAQQRMKNYIEECIDKVREETRLEKREDEVKRTVAKLMSGRELLNVYLGNAEIQVKVFKIDLNMQNSGLKYWEDAVRENSGGEKFVVFFSVLSALMSYTRSRTLEAAGAAAESDSSVLVMDNPFGPISSEHLLNPLFEIAKKHRTQLICLSDLKQNSIMNCFNLIYMLKVRTSAIGNKEYLKFEEIIRDQNALEHDEKLEKAVFRVSEVKQISLFN